MASALLLESLVLIIMRERNYDLNNDHLSRINRTSLCFVVFALVDLAKTLGCRLLSLRVNAESLFDLLKVWGPPGSVLVLAVFMLDVRCVTCENASRVCPVTKIWQLQHAWDTLPALV